MIALKAPLVKLLRKVQPMKILWTYSKILATPEGDEGWQTPQDWLAEDFIDSGYQLMSDIEIIAEVTRDNIDSVPESDVEIVLQPSVTHTQAFDAFQTALDWLEVQSDTDPSHLLLVRKWRDTAARKQQML